MSEQQDAAERGREQAVNLARHLNERYPDTVLFLARTAASRPDATTASLLMVEPHALTLTTDVDDVPVSVPLPGQAGEPGDVRERVRALLVTMRAAHPTEPATSLEQMQVSPTQAGHGPHRH